MAGHTWRCNVKPLLSANLDACEPLREMPIFRRSGKLDFHPDHPVPFHLLGRAPMGTFARDISDNRTDWERFHFGEKVT